MKINYYWMCSFRNEKRSIMKKTLLFASTLFLLVEFAQAQNEVFSYPLNNGDTLWYQCHYAQNENDSNYAVITTPNADRTWQGHQKPHGQLSIPDSLPQPWWWCDTTGWENYPGGFDQAWRDLAQRVPVVILGMEAFGDCSDIISVDIPNSVRIIWAFGGCTGLTSVTIGESVEELSDAFRGCSHLTTIRSYAEYPPICDEHTFEGVPNYADIIVPCGAAYRYQLSDYWNSFSRITEDCDGIEDVDMDDIHLWSKNGQIYVDGAYGLPVNVYNMVGQSVRNESLPTGVYMVKVGNYPARKVVVIR